MSISSERADAKFADGFNCAQAVMFPFIDRLGVDADMALKLSCGFGAGMGRKGEICGAVSGGILVLGALYGRGASDEQAATQTTYAKVSEFMNRFAALHGTCVCRELLSGCNLHTPEGQQAFKDLECREAVCRPCVRDAAALLDDIIS